MPRTLALVLFVTAWRCVFGNVLLPWKGPTENSHQVVLEKWTLLDQSIKNLMNSSPTAKLYKALEDESARLGVSEPCRMIMLDMIDGLRQLREWPVKMLDASGRIPSGLISGTTADLGNYDQCVDIRELNSGKLAFQGQYCLINIRPSLPTKPRVLTAFNTIPPFVGMKTDNHLLDELRRYVPRYYDIPITVGICVPSLCTREDLNETINHLSTKVGLSAVVQRCEMKNEWEVDKTQIAILCIFGFFLFLCIVGTVVDNNAEIEFESTDTLTMRTFLLSFSVTRNCGRLLSVDQSDDQALHFLNGLRVFSINWVILGHTYLLSTYEAMQNLKTSKKWMASIPFQFINGAAIAVDTPIVISSFLLTFLTLKRIDESGPQIFNVPLIIFHRVFRLLPPMLLVMGLMVLAPLAGSGPMFHDVLDVQVKSCRENWWYNLLFLQNIPAPSEKCLYHTWFLAVDFQVFILSLIFTYLVIRNLKFALIFNFTTAIASVAFTGWITHVKGFGPYPTMNDLNFETLGEFAYYTHMQIHTHVAAGCIGMLLGVYLSKRKKETPNRELVFVGWTVMGAMMCCLIYFPVIWNREVVPSPLQTIAFASLCRVFWALGNAWIIFTCYTGCSGVLNAILSWRVIIQASRLSYLVYLIHPLVIYVIYANMRVNIVVINIAYIHWFFGFFMTSHLLSFAGNILVVSPIMQLEKIIMKSLLTKNNVSTVEENVKTKKTK